MFRAIRLTLALAGMSLMALGGAQAQIYEPYIITPKTERFRISSAEEAPRRLWGLIARAGRYTAIWSDASATEAPNKGQRLVARQFDSEGNLIGPVRRITPPSERDSGPVWTIERPSENPMLVWGDRTPGAAKPARYYRREVDGTTFDGVTPISKLDYDASKGSILQIDRNVRGFHYVVEHHVGADGKKYVNLRGVKMPSWSVAPRSAARDLETLDPLTAGAVFETDEGRGFLARAAGPMTTTNASYAISARLRELSSSGGYAGPDRITAHIGAYGQDFIYPRAEHAFFRVLFQEIGADGVRTVWIKPYDHTGDGFGSIDMMKLGTRVRIRRMQAIGDYGWFGGLFLNVYEDERVQPSRFYARMFTGGMRTYDRTDGISSNQVAVSADLEGGVDEEVPARIAQLSENEVALVTRLRGYIYAQVFSIIPAAR